MIIKELREELVGPSPYGTEIDCAASIKFEKQADSYGPWRQKGSGEEIINRDSPTVRYGVGVLYPREIGIDNTDNEQELMGSESAVNIYKDINFDEQDPVDADDEGGTADIKMITIGKEWKKGDADGDDFDLSTANAYKPSSVGISFMVTLSDDSLLIVEASGGRYRERKVQVGDKEYTWWLRSPVSIRAVFSAKDILSGDGIKVPYKSLDTVNMEGLDLAIEVYSRTHSNIDMKENARLLTVCLINRKSRSQEKAIDNICLFQSYFKAFVESPDKEPKIIPYHKVEIENPDDEESSLSLLYRRAETYAVGHGCAANWDDVPKNSRVNAVSAECLPVIEIPSITPEIKRSDGTPVEVSMAALAGLISQNDGLNEVQEVIDLYLRWIDLKKQEALSIDSCYVKVAERHLAEARSCAQRMQKGFYYLKHDTKALQAFRLANYAMLLQQTRPKEPRLAQFDQKSSRVSFSEPYPDPDVVKNIGGRGKWRAFQIAFLLMSVESAANGGSLDRDIVELIWFPTGGGKTEAYLGLAAFSIFLRRLRDPEDTGVHALMRYTLRLLTAQQFQRASGLLNAMEYLRRKNTKDLGDSEFSIGIWVGSDTTPNRRKGAVESLRLLKKPYSNGDNPFILNRCPWCGAQMGRMFVKEQGKRPSLIVLGYEQRGETVVFKCPDNACEFSTGLPVYIIDEDIYENKPSLIIGTVDKFAMLAWRPEARALFGFDEKGERICSPPGLIIQDELHLISGPLGSMVGLYETVIEELCTDYREAQPINPKIICSTATIRRYAEQVKALYGRERVTLFPSPGLEIEDSFFACYARDDNGHLMPGKKFIGVHGAGLGSMQTTQVRTFSAALQAPIKLKPDERDPWWTMLTFFNSLRELGTTLSLFQSDIFDYLKVIKNRQGFDFNDMRRLQLILELTGRLQSDKIPEAITNLEIPYNAQSKRAIDVCLASNIIEVGIDIDRLSIMAVVGQPKTTSQYIQVTGRVGRRWRDRPGLVLTLYGASKPRDRSHFEKFRSYHERLYAQVEPTSVTPFSPPALDRALHAAMVSYVRQIEDSVDPYPVPKKSLQQFSNIVIDRVAKIDPNEQPNTEEVLRKRIKQWEDWQPLHWSQVRGDDNIPLIREAGAYATKKKARYSWSTPMSMRNVDAECQAEITMLYLQGESERNG
jgi:hypothetical protein